MRGIGTDIVNIERITSLYRKEGRRFLMRILSQKERAVFADMVLEEKQIAYLAKRFAGKEALSKAIGTGVAEGFSFSDISILNDEFGKPYIELAGSSPILSHISKEMDPVTIHISLSDDHPFAVAFVVISG